jgi:Flagellar hook-length control protein FliK
MPAVMSGGAPLAAAEASASAAQHQHRPVVNGFEALFNVPGGDQSNPECNPKQQEASDGSTAQGHQVLGQGSVSTALGQPRIAGDGAQIPPTPVSAMPHQPLPKSEETEKPLIVGQSFSMPKQISTSVKAAKPEDQTVTSPEPPPITPVAPIPVLTTVSELNVATPNTTLLAPTAAPTVAPSGDQMGAVSIFDGIATASEPVVTNVVTKAGQIPAARVDRRAKVDNQAEPGAAATVVETEPLAGLTAGPPTSPGSTFVSADPQADSGRVLTGSVTAMVASAAYGLHELSPAPDEPRGDPSKGAETIVSPALSIGAPTTPASTGAPTAQPSGPAAQPAGDANRQVAMHVAQALSDGGKTVTVELHPADLGRVELRFSFHSDGVNVRMTLDRPETFNAFASDRSGLEQQLAQAGVDLGGGGLDLRLGQQAGDPDSYPDGRNPRIPMPAALSAAASTSLWVSTNLVDILA